MWQSGTLQGILDGIDGAGIRPVFRATPSLVPPAPDEMARVDRHHQSGRQSDSASSRSPHSAIASAAACAVLDRLDQAIILLRSDGRVLLVNPAALRVAARGDCLRIMQFKLKLIDQQNQRLLELFLADRAANDSAPGEPLCVSSRDDGAHSYFLFAEWLIVPPPQCGPTASLLIYEPRFAGQLSHKLLVQLYGLTKMESRLVAALFIAPALRTAADRCGIAMNTAKTHLKHIFSKCGVGSKAELLRLLALGPRTL